MVSGPRISDRPASVRLQKAKDLDVQLKYFKKDFGPAAPTPVAPAAAVPGAAGAAAAVPGAAGAAAAAPAAKSGWFGKKTN